MLNSSTNSSNVNQLTPEERDLVTNLRLAIDTFFPGSTAAMFKIADVQKLLAIIDRLTTSQPAPVAAEPTPVLSDTTDWCAFPVGSIYGCGLAQGDSGYDWPCLKVADRGSVVSAIGPEYDMPTPAKLTASQLSLLMALNQGETVGRKKHGIQFIIYSRSLAPIAYNSITTEALLRNGFVREKAGPTDDPSDYRYRLLEITEAGRAALKGAK